MDILLLSGLLIGEWSTPGACEQHRSVFTNIDNSQGKIFYNIQKKGSDWVKSENYLWWTEGDVLFHRKKNGDEDYPIKVLSFSAEKVVYCPLKNCDLTFEMVKCS